MNWNIPSYDDFLPPEGVCGLKSQLDLAEPSDASTDRQGTLGIDPRAGTNFVLGPLSDRILISGALW